jgi:cytochrome c oxidase cbb3-type subunit 4
MLKFIKHHMATIGGVEIFPLISFLIFFLFFAGLIFWVIKIDKKSIAEVSTLPFQDGDTSINDKTTEG